MNRKWLLILAGCLAMALVLAACDDDDEVTSVRGGQPLLSEITASQLVVDAGDTVQLSVQAAGDNLVFLWSATAGSFTAPTADTTSWVAPRQPGIYSVTVTARGDNNLTASRSLALGVETALMLEVQQDSLTVAHQTRVVARAVGSNLQYLWSTTGGTITRQAAPDTITWKAPDQVPLNPPTVQVTVVDAQGHSRNESATITVLAYVPTDHPYYVGVTRCADCHGDLAARWGTSAHAGAVASLAAIGQNTNASCMACHTVGSHGFMANPALNNRGWDDVPLAALGNVQCENCHGPGSAHAARQVAQLPRPMDADVCGDCHNGPHHPTYEEWQTSGHGNVLEDTGTAPTRTTCAQCHNGAYAWRYLSDPANYTAPAAVDSTVEISCPVCHSPHGSDALAQLRPAALTDVVLPNGRVVPEAGAGRLCMACHNGRRAPTDIQDQIDNGSSHMGPHHSVQGDMLAGTGAYEAIAPTYSFGSSGHLLIADGCVHCHTAPATDPLTGATFTGHTFQPTLHACNECHGQLTSFDDVVAATDYDGDGVKEGVQTEITGLIEQLQAAIIAASDTPAHRTALEDAVAAGEFESVVGDATITTPLQRAAAYNLFFVEFDGSHGVHNAEYASELLQQSIQALQARARLTRR